MILFSSQSRKAQGVELQGNILIFDEAHNLVRFQRIAIFEMNLTKLSWN